MQELENITDKNISFTVEALILGKDIIPNHFSNLDAIQEVFGLTRKQAKFCLELANKIINKEGLWNLTNYKN